MCFLPPQKRESASQFFLRQRERVGRADRVLVHALEPPLVAHLHLVDPQLAAGHARRDDLVAAALVAVGRAREDLVAMVGGLWFWC